MIAETDYLHEARVKMTNAELSFKVGADLIGEKSVAEKFADIRELVETNQWNYGLARCIRSLKKDLGLL